MFREKYLEDLFYFYFGMVLGIDLRDVINAQTTLSAKRKAHLKDVA
jgi:hypothetical protein